MEQVIAKNKWSKVLNGHPYGENKPVLLEVKAELIKLEGNQFPYFSITGNIKKTDKRYRDPYIMGGCIHEEILKHFPQLAPLVDVHLSGADGQPIHAEANARYWAGLSKYEPKGNNPEKNPTETDEKGTFNPSILAQHLQTDEKTAREVRQGFLLGLPWDRITAQLGLIELWSDQAAKARALLFEAEMVGA